MNESAPFIVNAADRDIVYVRSSGHSLLPMRPDTVYMDYSGVSCTAQIRDAQAILFEIATPAAPHKDLLTILRVDDSLDQRTTTLIVDPTTWRHIDDKHAFLGSRLLNVWTYELVDHVDPALTAAFGTNVHFVSRFIGFT